MKKNLMMMSLAMMGLCTFTACSSSNDDDKKDDKGETDEEREARELLRQQGIQNTLYTFLLQKREEAQMSKALKTDIRMLTPPLGVKEQCAPVKKNVIFGAFLLGLFLPACAVFVRERNAKK